MRFLRKTTPLIVILREQIIILPTVSTFLREQHKKTVDIEKRHLLAEITKLFVSLHKILALDKAKKASFLLHLCSLNRIFAQCF